MPNKYHLFIIKIAGIFTIALGVLVIFGWIFDLQILKTMFRGYASMKLNTALFFLFNGLFILGFRRKQYLKTAWVSAILLFLFCASTCIEYITGSNIGIDQFFIKDYDTAIRNLNYPGRPAINTVLCFLVLSIGYVLLLTNNALCRKISIWLFEAVMLVAFTALLGYFFALPIMYQLNTYTSMALHTAIGLLVSSVGVAFFKPNYGIVGLFYGHKLGNFMARRLVIYMVPAILILAFLRIEAHALQLVSVEFGIALFATTFLLLMLVLIAITAKALNDIDVKRQAAEIEIRNINQNLEKTIKERTQKLLKANQDLESSNERFFKIFNLSASGIVINHFDEKNRAFVNVNTGFTNLLGYEAHEVIGKSAQDLHIVADEDRIRITEKLMKTGFLKNEEAVLIKKGGEKIHTIFNVDFFSLDDENYVLSTFIDISERKHQEQKLNELTKYLTKQNLQLEEFAGIVSHNLRGPTGNLSAILNLYKEEITTDGKENLMSMFEHTVNHLGNTLNELLEVVIIKHESKKAKELLSFASIFEKQYALIEAQLLATNGVITTDFGAAKTIMYHRLYLESIIHNLISNSIKYQSPLRPLVVSIKTRLENHKTVLSITDNGLGIDMKRNGEKLFGLHKTFHKHPEAKGVGLFITKSQVEAMGGQIYAESTLNEGTTFTIIF